MHVIALVIGGFEMLVVASIISLLSGIGILQRTERERRGMRLFGRVLLYVGGGVIALFVILYFYSR